MCGLPAADLLHEMIRAKAFVGTQKVYKAIGLTEPDRQALQQLKQEGFVKQRDPDSEDWQVAFKALQSHSASQSQTANVSFTYPYFKTFKFKKNIFCNQSRKSRNLIVFYFSSILLN